MESLSVPTNAAEARMFMAPGSLSYPQGNNAANGNNNHNVKGEAAGGEAKGKDGGADQATADEDDPAYQGVSGIVPTLQNIVATVNLDCRLDLKTIALHARNAEFNPKVSFVCIPCAVIQPD